MKSINGPLQDLWLTRAGGDRPVGTPQFGRLYPRPPTKCLPARKTPVPPIFFEILCGLLLSSSANKYDRMVSAMGHVFPFSIPTHRV